MKTFPNVSVPTNRKMVAFEIFAKFEKKTFLLAKIISEILEMFWLECKKWATAGWAVVILKHTNVYDKNTVESATLPFSILSFFQI